MRPGYAQASRPARSPCITCAPCTARRPISPAGSAGCYCSSTAQPRLGPCSASPAGSEIRRFIALAGSPTLMPRQCLRRSGCPYRRPNIRGRSTRTSSSPAGGSGCRIAAFPAQLVRAGPDLRKSQFGWKTNVRSSMLSRGRASAGVVGSVNEVCAMKRARPSVFVSQHLSSSASSRRISGT
jgi:hypothetical protein